MRMVGAPGLVGITLVFLCPGHADGESPGSAGVTPVRAAQAQGNRDGSPEQQDRPLPELWPCGITNQLPRAFIPEHMSLGLKTM